ncbi:MAG: BamA/TamA family outer membrane protein [Planctomycetota bacterium]|jgi:hypothetical protein
MRVTRFLFVLACCFAPSRALSQYRIVDVNEGFEQESFLLPYPFYNESIGFAAGLAYGFVGKPQEQMSLVGTSYLSTDGSWAVFLLGWDIETPFSERLFLDPRLSFAQLDELEVYRDGDPDFPTDRAGTNDSDKDNFVESSGDDYYLNLPFKYLFPIGNGRTDIINKYVVDDGFLVSGQSGGGPWNPFEGGRTYLEVEPFWRKQTVDEDPTEDAVQTNGVTFSLLYDNTDFRINPSKGSSQRIGISRDWGLGESTNPWTVIEAEYSKYFALGSAKGIRQQVLAFNCWTADTPTWKRKGFDENGKEVFERPPSYAGATLGGVDRMRAYPPARFNDQAAIYYALEYRVIPDWNPFASGIFEKAEIEWVQGVLFAEVGRVAGKWTLKELHSDMKWDVGVGVRLWVKNLIVRMDTAFSEEGTGVQFMAGHPF